jgi:site-specific DNA recombinase
MDSTKALKNKAQTRARAIAYLRASTDDQETGLDAQLDACRVYAERNGLDLVVCQDHGISGSTGLDKRPGLLEALGQIEPGDILLVAKRDRLARDPIVSAMVEAAVLRRKARIVSVAGEGTDGDDPSSVLFRRIIDAFAEYERLVIKARTRSALAALRSRGRRSGTLPYGQGVVDDGQHSKSSIKRGKPLPSKLVESERERGLIESIIRMAEDLKLSPRAIARILDSQGVATRLGRPWHHNSVRAILARAKSARGVA